MNDSDDGLDISSERAKRKLERDMGPLLLAALHDPKRSKSCSTPMAGSGRNDSARK